MLELNKIHCVEAREGLKKVPSESIDCVVTSPPYWAMRDYGIPETTWNDGTKSVLGLEPTVDDYLNHLLEVFNEIKRVLKKTGTLWVNLGDTYSGSWGGYAQTKNKKAKNGTPENGTSWKRRAYENPSFRPPSSLKQQIPARSLCLIPSRFAVAMADNGWILRNAIVWHKPNPMPQSMKSRFSSTWEYVFFFVKHPKYYFDLDGVRVPHKSLQKKKSVAERKVRERPSSHISGGRRCPNPGEVGAFHPLGKNPGDYWVLPSETRTLGAVLGKKGAVKIPGGKGWTGHAKGGQARIVREQDPRWLSPLGKNPGDSWDIAVRPSKGAHFAVFPERLCERPILAGCPVRVCRRCGVPSLKRVTGGTPYSFDIGARDASLGRNKYPFRRPSAKKARGYDEKTYRTPRRVQEVLGCRCRKGFDPGVVLDPFMGSGTTALVAKRLARRFIGFEVNPDYSKMARKRVQRGSESAVRQSRERI